MKIGKAFLIASSLVVGLGVVGYEAEAKTLKGHLKALACDHCSTWLHVGTCLGIKEGKDPQTLSTAEKKCVVKYCGSNPSTSAGQLMCTFYKKIYGKKY